MDRTESLETARRLAELDYRPRNSSRLTRKGAIEARGGVALATAAARVATNTSQRLLAILGSRRRREEFPDVVRDFRQMTEATEGKELLTTVALKKVQINARHETFGKAEVYIITSVLDGSGTALPEYRTPLFEGVDDQTFLPIGDGGLLVYFQKDPKYFLDLHGVIMESDSDVRQLGATIEAAKKEAKFDEIERIAKTLTAFDPSRLSAIFSGVSLFLDVLVYLLKNNKDDHIATFHDFYLRQQRYGAGLHPAEGLMPCGDAEISYEIAVTEM